tara:strand:+ start:2693 stop:3475 length:783 start_codon:yes stop_codon:yes gene_type:complete
MQPLQNGNMMNAKEFIRLIDQYDPLNATANEEFLSISEQYPYFQLPSYYHTKSLKEQKSEAYQKALNRLALLTLDRKVLKNAMELSYEAKTSDASQPTAKKPVVQKTKKKDKIAKGVKKVKESAEKVSSNPDSQEKDINKIKLSFTQWISLTEDNKIVDQKMVFEDKKSPLEDKLIIIDQFIENDPKISPILKSENNSAEIEFNDYTEELMTETLAKVLVKQKKYRKALSAYKILSLKYPEKNVFFAGQIEKIKNLQQRQ